MNHKDKSTFSIIVPVLNEEKYLPNLLKDLSSQSFKDFEIIIVDGNSEDKTILKAKSYTKLLPKLKIITTETRHVCSQRNLGSKHATSDWLIFMDADNRLPPYFLQGIKYRIETEPVDIVSCWIKPDIDNPTNDLIALGINIGIEIQNNVSLRFLLESMIIIKKKAFNLIGGFDTSIDYAEGINFMLSANKLDLKFKMYRDPTYKYSFRRYRKFGSIKTLKVGMQLGLSNLLGKKSKNLLARELYPMLGGQIFATSNKRKSKFLMSIDELLKELR